MAVHTHAAGPAHASASPPRPTTGGDAGPREVQQWLASGRAVLIDVRDPDEHAREKIPGSLLMPLSAFDPDAAAALLKPGQTLVLHCKGGMRGGEACRRCAVLRGRGIVVANLTGGIDAWKQESLPTVVNTSISRISVMRQTQLVIGSLVLAGSALAWFVDPAFVGIPAFFGAGLVFAGASGTCMLANLLGRMPWNRADATSPECEDGSCGRSH